MTVYIAHSPRLSDEGKAPDLSSAARFGAIVSLLERGEHPGLNPEYASRRLKERLEKFDPEKDHILWVMGDPLSLMLITAELIARGVTSFSWLRSSRKLDANKNRTGEIQYFPTRVDLSRFKDAPSKLSA